MITKILLRGRKEGEREGLILEAEAERRAWNSAGFGTRERGHRPGMQGPLEAGKTRKQDFPRASRMDAPAHSLILAECH